MASKKRTLRLCSCVLVSFPLLAADLAWSQEKPEASASIDREVRDNLISVGTAEDGEDDEPFLRLRTVYGFASGADLEDSSAEFGYSKLGFGAELPFVDLQYEAFLFDWNGASSWAPANGTSKPWDTLHQLRVDSRVPFELTDTLSMMVGLGGTLAWEDEASDAFSLSGLLGLRWQPSDIWVVMLGAGYNWHPDVDQRLPLLPLVGIEYKPDVETGFSAALGLPAMQLKYGFTPNNSISARLRGDGGIFRLANDSRVAPRGYAELSKFEVGLFYDHTVWSDWDLSLGASYAFENQLRIYDSGGYRISTTDADGAVGVTFGITKRF